MLRTGVCNTYSCLWISALCKNLSLISCIDSVVKLRLQEGWMIWGDYINNLVLPALSVIHFHYRGRFASTSHPWAITLQRAIAFDLLEQGVLRGCLMKQRLLSIYLHPIVDLFELLNWVCHSTMCRRVQMWIIVGNGEYAILLLLLHGQTLTQVWVLDIAQIDHLLCHDLVVVDW